MHKRSTLWHHPHTCSAFTNNTSYANSSPEMQNHFVIRNSATIFPICWMTVFQVLHSFLEKTACNVLFCSEKNLFNVVFLFAFRRRKNLLSYSLLWRHSVPSFLRLWQFQLRQVGNFFLFKLDYKSWYFVLGVWSKSTAENFYS